MGIDHKNPNIFALSLGIFVALAQEFFASSPSLQVKMRTGQIQSAGLYNMCSAVHSSLDLGDFQLQTYRALCN